MTLFNRNRITPLLLLIVVLSLLPNLTQGQQEPFPLPGEGNHGRAAADGETVRDGLLGARGNDVITDGSMEAGPENEPANNPFWVQSSTSYGTVICTVPKCQFGTVTNPTVGPRTGTKFAWFGGAFTPTDNIGDEIGTLSQLLRLSSGRSVTLQFYLWIGEFTPGGADTLTVTLGNAELIRIREDDARFHNGYAAVNLDLSPFADGVERLLTFTVTDILGKNTNFSVDDISLVNAVAGIELLSNNGFESQDQSLLPWELKNPSKDKIQCNKPDKQIARTGNCAFRFKGVPGERTKLRQTPDLTGQTFIAGDSLDLSLWVRAGAAPSARAKLRVFYSDGTARGKRNIDLPLTVGYQWVNANYTFTSGAVERVRLSIDNKKTTGKFWVDDVSLKKVLPFVPTETPQPTLMPPTHTIMPGSTATPGSTLTPSITPTASYTVTPSDTPSASYTPTPSDTPSASNTPTPTSTPTNTGG